MNADGSGRRKLVDDTTGADPVWSPDGSKIAFHRGADVFVMNADGSGETKLTDGQATGEQLAWSPDGSQIAFAGRENYVHDIYVAKVDGSGLRQLTEPPRDYVEILWIGIDWSPDGSQIAFVAVAGANVLDTDIHVVNVDGSGQRKLTDIHRAIGYPSWSPDGSQIAFSVGG
jgi:Tol biopolymer transport system component